MTTSRFWQSYKLESLWAAIDEGRCVFHASARDGRNALGFTEDDGDQCLRELSRENFVKSSADRLGRRGVFHDVYKIVWGGRSIYIKLFRLGADEPFIVSSFKADDDSEV